MTTIKQYWNFAVPHNPLIEWVRINHDLNKIYPQYGIYDDPAGINVKNSARHFSGGALGNMFYGEDITNSLGTLKEIGDKQINKKKNINDLLNDTKIDYSNNQRGIEYTKKYPYVTRNDIYNEAINNAIKNYPNDYSEVYGNIQNDDLGQYGQGNIDLYNRPQVKNDDGSISTVRSMSFNDGKQEILIPTVSDDGKIMSDKEAYDNYIKTGKYLGKFNSIDDANNYAQKLHQQQQNYYLKGK